MLQHRPRIHAGKEGGADGTKRCQRDGHVHNKHQRAVFEDELLKALRHEAKVPGLATSGLATPGRRPLSGVGAKKITPLTGYRNPTREFSGVRYTRKIPGARASPYGALSHRRAPNAPTTVCSSMRAAPCVPATNARRRPRRSASAKYVRRRRRKTTACSISVFLSFAPPVPGWREVHALPLFGHPSLACVCVCVCVRVALPCAWVPVFFVFSFWASSAPFLLFYVMIGKGAGPPSHCHPRASPGRHRGVARPERRGEEEDSGIASARTAALSPPTLRSATGGASPRAASSATSRPRPPPPPGSSGAAAPRGRSARPA